MLILELTPLNLLKTFKVLAAMKRYKQKMPGMLLALEVAYLLPAVLLLQTLLLQPGNNFSALALLITAFIQTQQKTRPPSGLQMLRVAEKRSS